MCFTLFIILSLFNNITHANLYLLLSLFQEPLYLDKCIVCCETDLEDYFEIQELSSKETFIFKVRSVHINHFFKIEIADLSIVKRPANENVLSGIAGNSINQK